MVGEDFMNLRKYAAVLSASCLMLSGAALPSQANGIAFAYAPEQGGGVCVGEDAASTIDCARQKCAENTGSIEDCAPMAWCEGPGWSAGVGVMHKEGIHWSEFTCGWPSRDAAIAAAKVLCDLSFREYIQSCSAGVIYDPEGNEIILDDE